MHDSRAISFRQVISNPRFGCREGRSPDEGGEDDTENLTGNIKNDAFETF